LLAAFQINFILTDTNARRAKLQLQLKAAIVVMKKA
jgi:hypothetical protein